MHRLFATLLVFALVPTVAEAKSYFTIINNTNVEIRLTVNSQDQPVDLVPIDQGVVRVGETKQFFCRRGWYHKYADYCNVYIDETEGKFKLWPSDDADTGKISTNRTYTVTGEFQVDFDNLVVDEPFSFSPDPN